MPDPIQRRFGYGPVWPLLPVCSQNMAEQYMQEPTSSLRFISVFPKKAWIILCKNRPVSDLDGLVRGWPNASGLEASRCQNDLARFLAGHKRPATSFPTFRL